MYMIGGCTYEGVAGGSHNSDVYRFDLKTGSVVQVYKDADNPVQISCQCGQVYDRIRNCVWFSWANIYDTSGGLYRFQCPNGPITKHSDSTMGYGMYGDCYLYHDPVHDLLVAPGQRGLVVRDMATGDTAHYDYPGQVNFSAYEIPSCFDSKRGLVAITQWGGCWCANGPEPVDPPVLHDIYFFNTTTRQWHIKSPAVTPGPNFGSEMTYDAANDKYVYFGSGRLGYGLPELWMYDYDSNTWTQVQRNGRTYSRANGTVATWPANRFKHGWSYSEKYNVSVNWGGYNYIAGSANVDSTLIDLYFGAHQPLWYYRLGSGSSAAEESGSSVVNRTALITSPNPFNAAAAIHLPEVAGTAAKPVSLRIYSLEGGLVADLSADARNGHAVKWNAKDRTAGVYLVRYAAGNRVWQTRAVLAR
jgi:hypothetical protein